MLKRSTLLCLSFHTHFFLREKGDWSLEQTILTYYFLLGFWILGGIRGNSYISYSGLILLSYLTELQNSTTYDLMLHGKCGANAWPHAAQLTRILHDNLTKKKQKRTYSRDENIYRKRPNSVIFCHVINLCLSFTKRDKVVRCCLICKSWLTFSWVDFYGKTKIITKSEATQLISLNSIREPKSF